MSPLTIIYPLALVGLLLSGAQLARGLHSRSVRPNVIDQDSSEVELTVQALCHGRGNSRVSQLSTISNLVDVLESDSGANGMDSCRKQYLEPSLRLKEVLSQHNDDICSLEKANLIAEFHYDYVAASLSKKWHKVSDLTCPEPLRVFFMHYASEVNRKCKGAMQERLQSVAGSEDPVTLSSELGRLGKVFKEISVTADQVRNFDDFALLWDMILKEHRKKGNRYDQTDSLGEMAILDVKMKQPEEIWSIQHKCRHQLRPVYQNTVLPVMKLIDLGYDRKETPVGGEIERDSIIKEWYSIVQTCELLLPISFYKDETLGASEAQIMDPQDVTQHLSGIVDTVPTKDIPSRTPSPAIQIDNILPATLTETDRSLVKLVKANSKSRGSYYKRVWRNVTANLKGKLKDKLRNLFVLKSSKGKKVVSEGSIDDSIEKTDEMMNESELDESESTRLVRRRRYAPTGANGEMNAVSKSRFSKISGYSFLVLVVISWIVAIVVTCLTVG